jgi:ABC-2 type transport system ATP-binding protein
MLERCAIHAEDLVKVYPDEVTAISSISLNAAEGEVVGVLGPNGAGKSTMLKILTTLLRPTSGRATVFGFDVRDTKNVRPLLGVALQDVGLDPLMSGNAHFEVQAALYGIKPDVLRKVSDPLIERFMLGSYLDRAVGAYSGGTQRKLALALALCTSPPVTIFDEPTVGLDPHSRRQVWELIEEMRMQGKVVLFSTQYMDEAEKLCDKIYVIDKGQIAAEGGPEELKALVGEGTLRIVVDAPAKLRTMIDGLHPGGVVKEDGEAVVVKIPVGSKLPAAILGMLQSDGLAVREFSLSPPTLEDIFLHLTGHSLRPEPLGRSAADMGLSMHRGGGSKWR